MESSVSSHASWHSIFEQLPLESSVRYHQSLKRFNTLRVGGEAEVFIDVLHEVDLALILQFCHEHNVPWFILGKGSNLLVADENWPGIILRLSHGFKDWEPNPETREVLVGAGLSDVTVAQRCICQGWTGLEFLIGVPGTIGGAVAMNAGAHGVDIAASLKEVWWLDFQGKRHHELTENLSFAYRNSPLNAKHGKIVTLAKFQLGASDCNTVRETTQRYKAWRLEKQPKRQPNCGSVFKNPPNAYAAELIENVGLKGKTIGQAQFSTKHSNFIVNLGDATASDVLALIKLAQQEVFRKYQVSLEVEVEIVSPHCHAGL